MLHFSFLTIAVFKLIFRKEFRRNLECRIFKLNSRWKDRNIEGKTLTLITNGEMISRMAITYKRTLINKISRHFVLKELLSIEREEI